MLKNICLNDVNPHIVCTLCKGYFIDPVTLVECLHSFCKTCIVKYVKTNTICPTCEVQIHKTRPLLSMKSDKILQNIVYKLVPNLYAEEMKRRKKFQELHEPTKVPREELEKHFFLRDDKISMSIEYYDSQNPNGSPIGQKNLNRRYLECPGTVKVHHLKKFITLKYGLTEKFVIDIIYMNDIIPEDYTLIDVAYYYKWDEDAPMRFFYRIFKKTRVYLKRRKSSLNTEESNSTQDVEPQAKKPRMMEDQTKKINTPSVTSNIINGNEQHPGIRSYNVPEEIPKLEIVADLDKETSKSPSRNEAEQVCPKSPCLVLRIDKENPAFSTCQNKSMDDKKELFVQKLELKVAEVKTEVVKSSPEGKKESESAKDGLDESKCESPPDKMRILSISTIIKPNFPLPESKENSAPSPSPTPSGVTSCQNLISEIVEAREAKCQNELKLEMEKSVGDSVGQQATSPVQSKPKQAKMGNGSQILSVINNLTKKQLNLEASLNKEGNSLPTSKTSTGETVTLTGGKPPTPPTSLVTTTTHQTLTVKPVFTTSSPINGTPVNISPNSLKNVSQKSLLSNVTILSPTEKSKQTLTDLRQFRKVPPDNIPSKPLATPLTLQNKPKPLTPSQLSGGSHKLQAAPKPIQPIPDYHKTLQMLKSSVSKTFPILSAGNTTASITQQAQLPSSRLQLKVQQPPPLSPYQAAFQSTLYTQLAAETLWKQQQSAAAAVMQANFHLASTTTSKAFGGLSKNPNQGIRQIPNPSLFAKQQQEIIMAMAAAAVIRGGGDPRSNGERQ